MERLIASRGGGLRERYLSIASLTLAWREEPLSAAATAAASPSGRPDVWIRPTAAAVSEAVAGNRSVLAVPNFAIAAEIAELRAACDFAEKESRQNALTSTATCLRFEVNERELSQDRVAAALGGAATQALADRLVRRALRFVQLQLPALAESLELSSACSETCGFMFSEGEPAINLYYGPSGNFMPHQDARALTLLLPLSEADEFGGGGTAFYAHDASLPSCRNMKTTPLRVIRPTAGTALMWGSSLIHAGAEVTSGRRLVFVASFTPV